MIFHLPLKDFPISAEGIERANERERERKRRKIYFKRDKENKMQDHTHSLPFFQNVSSCSENGCVGRERKTKDSIVESVF
jgi:hypothetical protein